MQAFFLPVGNGQRFCIFHPSQRPKTLGAVIYIHPFAEEMNKSRRMIALQARALACEGYAVLQIDLLGCGDSTGDFGDATWNAWRDDVLGAYRWLRGQTDVPLILWGLRAGCLLAANVAADLPEDVDFVFWQPILSGKQQWQQFMRLKMANGLATGQAKGVAEQLRQQLAAGQAVEIAGYTISPMLVAELEKVELQPSGSNPGRLAWLDLSMRDGAGLTPAAQQHIAQWQAVGRAVDARMLHGPAFWQTAEIEDAPELISASMAAIASWQ